METQERKVCKDCQSSLEGRNSWDGLCYDCALDEGLVDSHVPGERKLIGLESFLRQTQADQGGDASFEDWVRATAEEESEFGHNEAEQYLRFGGDLRPKNLSTDGEWKVAEARESIADDTLAAYQFGNGVTVVAQDNWNTDDEDDYGSRVQREDVDQSTEAKVVPAKKLRSGMSCGMS